MGTKANPAPFDCYANAEDDEPMFVLLARDRDAAQIVKIWAALRALRDGVTPQVIEALECAGAMVEWRLANRSERVNVAHAMRAAGWSDDKIGAAMDAAAARD